MEDKFSSPSSSSLSGSTNTPHKPRGLSQLDNDGYLVVRTQPYHVFPDEEFDVVFAVEQGRSRKSPPSALNLALTLEMSKREKSSMPTAGPSTASLVIVEEPRFSMSRGTGKARCRVEFRDQLSSEGVSFVLRLASRDQNASVTPVVTAPINLVNAKLRISTASDWESIWYKDEGGRDKSMEVLASAYDRNGNIYRGKIQLSIKLCYNTSTGPIHVLNQEILRVLGSERKLQLDSSTSEVKIRFRVEDVSKNHQGQDFVLDIRGDKNHQDIGPASTPPVSVRSKRNKRNRGTAIATSTANTSEQRARSSPLTLSSSAHQPRHPMYPATEARTGSAGLGDGPESGRFLDAVRGVIQWCEEVVNGMYPLQWQVLGYAHNPDGSLDYNRPYHNMQNPNAFISRVLTVYNESTRDQLHTLSEFFEAESGLMLPSSLPSSRIVDPRAFGGGHHHHLPPPLRSPPPLHHRDPYLMVPPGYMPSPQPPHHHPGMLPSVMDPLAHGPQPINLEYPPHGYYSSGPPPPPPQQQHPRGATRMDEPLTMLRTSDDESRLSAPPHLALARDRQSVSSPDPGTDYGVEANVEYVLAKQYKSLQTGEHLGFPAYSAEKEILGFYCESDTRVGVRHFVPIGDHAQYFGPDELSQAREILEDEISKKSAAVHAIKDWGSLASLLDHALVYDWSKDITNTGAPKGL